MSALENRSGNNDWYYGVYFECFFDMETLNQTNCMALETCLKVMRTKSSTFTGALTKDTANKDQANTQG